MLALLLFQCILVSTLFVRKNRMGLLYALSRVDNQCREHLNPDFGPSTANSHNQDVGIVRVRLCVRWETHGFLAFGDIFETFESIWHILSASECRYSARANIA